MGRKRNKQLGVNQYILYCPLQNKYVTGFKHTNPKPVKQRHLSQREIVIKEKVKKDFVITPSVYVVELGARNKAQPYAKDIAVKQGERAANLSGANIWLVDYKGERVQLFKSNSDPFNMESL